MTEDSVETGGAPLVSVVIPTFNRPDLLQRAVESVLKQDYPAVEIIVSDDHSEVDISGFHDRYVKTGKVRFLRNDRNLGKQPTCLAAVEHSRGQFVALLDDDDWWSPSKLSIQMEVMLRSPHALLASRLYCVVGSSQVIEPGRAIEPNESIQDFIWSHGGWLQTSTMLGERKLIQNLIEANLDARVHVDTRLFYTAQQRGIEIVQIPDALTFFDGNPRTDRISNNPALLDQSLDWFRSVSKDWSPETRQAYLYSDTVERCWRIRRYRQAIGIFFVWERGFRPIRLIDKIRTLLAAHASAKAKKMLAASFGPLMGIGRGVSR